MGFNADRELDLVVMAKEPSIEEEVDREEEKEEAPAPNKTKMGFLI